MTALRLALFDCDGTLADSEYAIVAAMRDACSLTGQEPRDAQAVRETIGLSVPNAIARLFPDSDAAQRGSIAEAYRDAYFRQRSAAASQPEPLFDGMVQLIEDLHRDGWQLGVATGKSQRGLLRLLDAHGLTNYFATLQTADFHPSKPDPSMVYAALDQTLVSADHCVVIGDTSFDMQMARSAGAGAIGVTWGYHRPEALRVAGAQAIVSSADELLNTLGTLVGADI